MKLLRTHKRIIKADKGFTLIELLTSVAIFSIITTVAVFNNSKFNSSVLLTNTAYEVALAIRQAQFYGVNIKQSSDTSHTLAFQSGYGVRFAPGRNYFTLFEDASRDPDAEVLPDRIFGGSDGAPDREIEKFSLRRGVVISSICVLDGSTCSELNSGEPLDVTFLRPNPDAEIHRNAQSVTYSSARICVTAPDGTHRKVFVNTTGQISVAAGNATDCY